MSKAQSGPLPFLRVPPFPGAKALALAVVSSREAKPNLDPDRVLAALAAARVGGAFWGAQPDLPREPYVLLRVRDPARCDRIIKEFPGSHHVLCWSDGTGIAAAAQSPNVHFVSGHCDPWHLVSRADEVVADADDELALIAAIAGVRLRCIGKGRFASLAQASLTGLGNAVRMACLDGFGYIDPFTGEPTNIFDAIALCAFWRGLIDSNRGIAAAFGFAHWKRAAVAPLLWSGTNVRFARGTSGLNTGDMVAVWRSRTSADTLRDLAEKQIELIEVEDGFIRSAGLGADCIPPLSIVVDRIGVHFNPASPSELEILLERRNFSVDDHRRARLLIDRIVQSGVSKYGVEQGHAKRRVEGRTHILVTGQVEDDRSVLEGGGSIKTNLELLRRVRAEAPGAYILYKPHPDVEAGHRAGAIPDAVALSIADEVVRDEGISALIDMVDELHVITSLAGFEALLRGRTVTTHGVPFYAGWGLTRDLGPVPGRRTRRRTLEELAAAVLLIYPRYLDPDTGLPCPPEILIRRLSQAPSRRGNEGIVRLRRLQGLLKRLLTTPRLW